MPLISSALLDKYGSQDAVHKSSQKALVTESETFVEYDETGAVKGAPKSARKSRYAEDVFTNNHTTVWGSWWSDFKWGYACCHSTVKNSFCTGEEGRIAAEEAETFSRGLALPSAEDADNATRVDAETAAADEAAREAHVPNAVDRPEKQNLDESRRRLEEMTAGVTEAEMEKYRREKVSKSDPMAAMLGRDELVGGA